MKVVLQDGIKDCGICCLLSIIRFYGGEVSKEYLREITHTTKDGVSLYHLIEGAEKIGFEATGVTGKLEDINVNNLPCIAHFVVNKSYKHFVVLYELNLKKQRVTLMDPAKGKKIISISEFALLSSSNYLFLKPKKKLPIIKKKNIIYKNILTLFLENKKILFFIVILSFCYFIVNIVASFHFKYLLEYSINYNLSYPIYSFSVLLLILYGFKNINLFLRNLLLQKWISIFDYETTSLTYKQLLLLPYLYYKDRTTGEVVSRFRDLNVIRSFISNLFCIATTDIISLFLFFLILFQYSKYLTLFIMIPLLFFFLLTLLFDKKKKKFLSRVSRGEDTINSYIIQGISNVDTIKGSHMEKRLVDKFSINYKSFLESIYHFRFLVEMYDFFKNNIYDITFIILYGVGSFYVINDKLSLSTLIVFQTFFSYFLNCFYRLLSVIEEYDSFLLSLNRVEEIFMISRDNFLNNYFYLSYRLDGDILFHNLTYQFGSKKLFDNLNLTIYKGQKVLLSGESGMGKSTLLKMLLRYIDVDYDSIRISGIDINHYHLENIRSNITYVTSNEYLFTDTVRNNILLYKECSDEEFNSVCQMCLVDDIIKNHLNGYDSLIEENGFNFSNGERQRIILARSLMRKSNIYILDEALSGIDISREKKILDNIFHYLEDKTIIVISHRFHNKKLFDRVLKLENGVIHES